MIELTQDQKNWVAAIGLGGIISQLRCNLNSNLPCFVSRQEEFKQSLSFWLKYRKQINS